MSTVPVAFALGAVSNQAPSTGSGAEATGVESASGPVDAPPVDLPTGVALAPVGPPAAADEPGPPAPPAPPTPSPPPPPPPAPEPPPPPPPSGEVVGGHPGEAEVNGFRAANGVAGLAWDAQLEEKAVAWSQHLADAGALSHSTLSDGVPAGWSALAENVSYSSSLAGALAALEASPPHRANLLDGRFTRFAVGVVVQDGRYWVTQVFWG